MLLSVIENESSNFSVAERIFYYEIYFLHKSSKFSFPTRQRAVIYMYGFTLKNRRKYLFPKKEIVEMFVQE